MSTLSSAIESHIQDFISKKPAGSKLPSVREMSRKLNVSPATVQQVFNKFRKKNLIETIHGKGTFIARRSGAKQPDSPKPIHDEKFNLYDWLVSRIARGEIKRSQPLPSVKELSVRFRVGHRTVIRAYRKLVQNGTAIKTGKRYWLSDFSQFRTYAQRSHVVLVIDDNTSPRALFSSHELSETIREMEYELADCGVALRVIPFRQLAAQRGAWERHGRAPLGLAVADIRQPFYDRILPTLRHMRSKPLYAHTHFLMLGRRAAPLLENADFFAIGSMTTAILRTVARYCAQQDIRSVMVFHHSNPTNVDRLRYCIRLMPEVHSLSPGTDIRYVVSPIKPKRTFEKLVIEMGEGDEKYIPGIISKYEHTPLSELTKRIAFTADFKKWYREAPDRCLCIFSKDSTAAEAIDYFVRAGTKIPAQRAILGIENDPSFIQYGISSCVPDWRTAGYLCAHAILKDVPVERSRRGFIRASARFLGRLTTA